MIGKYMRGLQLRIINDDCLNVVKTFESESIDLIYLDPPFNTGKDWKQFDDRFKPDLQSRQQTTGKLRQLLDVFSLGYCDYMAIRLKELHRVLKPTGSLYLHCDPTASHYIKLILDAVLGVENYQNEIIWHYRRWTGKASPSERKEVNNNHCTVKPIKLMEYLITMITPPNGVVLDPFLGSGTTAIACRNLGFDCIGIEKEAEYIEIINARLEHHGELELSLFEAAK
jgi:DNA modification methylase